MIELEIRNPDASITYDIRLQDLPVQAQRDITIEHATLEAFKLMAKKVPIAYRASRTVIRRFVGSMYSGACVEDLHAIYSPFVNKDIGVLAFGTIIMAFEECGVDTSSMQAWSRHEDPALLLASHEAWAKKEDPPRPMQPAWVYFDRLCIAGSRSTTRAMVNVALDHFRISGAGEVVCGMARGADRHGFDWAGERGFPVAEFYADWDRLGRAAGSERNGRMARYVHSSAGRRGVLIVVDGDERDGDMTPGSRNMRTQSEKLNGVRVMTYTVSRDNEGWFADTGYNTNNTQLLAGPVFPRGDLR